MMNGETSASAQGSAIGEAPMGAVVEESKPAAKPWIAAGFESRAKWRAAKRQAQKSKHFQEKMIREGANPVKNKSALKKRAKSAKSRVKAVDKKKVKTKAKVKAEPSKTAAERRAAAERTLAAKKAMARREEPNEKEKRVLFAFGGKDKIKTIAELGEKAFPSKKAVIQRSWARNALRWIVASKRAKRVAGGQYKKVR
jgi:hypothetical protein